VTGRYIVGRRRHGRGRAGPGGPGAPRPLKFAGGDAFWQMLWWGILSDVPTGLERIDCPVILAQGTADLVAVGQTPRYLGAIAGARFVPLVGAGHAPQSDTPDAILTLVRDATAAAVQHTAAGPRALPALSPSA
jgi:pimeloyl-ACP methyl ester carboxylesterase